MYLHRQGVVLLGLIAAAGFTGVDGSRKNLRLSQGAINDEEPPLDLLSSSSGGGGESLIAMQFSSIDPHGHRDKLEMILNGELSLSSIRFSPHSFANDNGEGSDSTGDSYASVYAEFCAYDPQLTRSHERPAAHPNAASIMADSEHCGEHRYLLPLGEVVEAAREHDASRSSAVRPLPISGLIFHEGHSGAGLLSNTLSSLDLPPPADVTAAAVISEHPAVHDALSACDVVRNRHRRVADDDCSERRRDRLVEDVIMLLSRSSDPERTKLYLKLSPQSSHYLPALTALYPDAPWAFVYRESSSEVLSKTMRRGHNAACIRSRRNPSKAFQAKSSSLAFREESGSGADDMMNGLTNVEVCALYLGAMLDVAMDERARTNNGMMLSYERDVQDPEFIVDAVLPFLGLRNEMDALASGGKRDAVVEGVRQVLKVRSNASHGKGNSYEWTGETVRVTNEVATASEAAMGELVEKIQNMRAR